MTTLPASIATIDRDLTALRQRRDDCLDQIQAALTDVANIEYRLDVLLTRRHGLTTIRDAVTDAINPAGLGPNRNEVAPCTRST